MSIVSCGSDDAGYYIEIEKPKGETPPCFIDDNGDVHDKIRIYDGKVKLIPSVSLTKVDRCVMCGSIVPEGTMVCAECIDEVIGNE